MSETIRLILEKLKPLRKVNPMMMSYNIEFAEVTGGTFWKAYTRDRLREQRSFMWSLPQKELQQCTRI